MKRTCPETWRSTRLLSVNERSEILSYERHTIMTRASRAFRLSSTPAPKPPISNIPGFDARSLETSLSWNVPTARAQSGITPAGRPEPAKVTPPHITFSLRIATPSASAVVIRAFPASAPFDSRYVWPFWTFVTLFSSNLGALAQPTSISKQAPSAVDVWETPKILRRLISLLDIKEFISDEMFGRQRQIAGAHSHSGRVPGIRKIYYVLSDHPGSHPSTIAFSIPVESHHLKNRRLFRTVV